MSKYVILTGLIVSLISVACEKTTNPQEQVTFVKTFGGQFIDEGKSVIQSSDGGYVLAGYIENSTTDKNVYVIKVDSKGNPLWERSIGGTDNEEAHEIRQTPDGGYIVVGENSTDVLLIKIDSQGNLQWQKSIGGSGIDAGKSISLTNDGGYIICGYTYSYGAGNGDVYLVKTDGFGNVQWQRTFGGSDRDIGYSVIQMRNGWYAIAGLTYSFGNRVQIYLVITDNQGNLLWQHNYGGSTHDGAYSIQQTPDGDLVITGFMGTETYVENVALIKTDSTGSLILQRVYGGSSDDVGYSIKVLDDGSFIIVGKTRSFGAGGSDVYLLKTNSSGDIQWTKTFGGTSDDAGYSVFCADDGGYILTGVKDLNFTNNTGDILLIKTDSEGNTGE